MTIRARDFLGDIETLVNDEGMAVAAACRRVASRAHVPFRSETLRKAYVRKRARRRQLQQNAPAAALEMQPLAFVPISANSKTPPSPEV
jgi:hypothetical protein